MRVFVPAVKRIELPLICSNLRGRGVRLVVVELERSFHVPVSSLQSRNGCLLPEQYTILELVSRL